MKYSGLMRFLFCFAISVILNSCVAQTTNNTTSNTDTIDSNETDVGYLIRDLRTAEIPTIFPQMHTNLNGKVSQFVRDMYEDNNGNFWFGTNGDGIIRYDGKSLEKFVSAKGLGIAVREILEDETGNIWFGTSDGLIKYDGKKFRQYSVKENLIDDEVWGLAIDTTGVIWVGTVKGVSKFDGENFTAFIVPKADVENPEPMLSENRISDIMIDNQNKIWFITDGYGITIFDGEHFSFLTEEKGLPDNNVADILEDRQGNI